MTLNPEQQRRHVLAAGFSNPLNLPANAEAEAHVKVYGDNELLTLSVDYTLEGVGDLGDLDEISGVNAILEADVLLEGFTTFTIEHDPPIDQATDLSGGGTLGRIYEKGLDAITRRMQALASAISRRLVMPVDSTFDPTLPLPSPRRALIWNEEGDGFTNSFEDPDSTSAVEANDAAARAEAAYAASAAALADAQAARDAAIAAQNAAEAAAAAAGDPEAIAAMGVPVGATMLFTHTSYPTSAFLKENGAVVSQAAYAALYAAIGSNYNTGGEGGGNFRLPESRGEFFRGWDDSRGVDSGRSLYAAQTGMVGPHTHLAVVADAGGHTHVVTMTANTRYGANRSGSPETDFGTGDSTFGTRSRNMSVSTAGAHTHTITISNNDGTETRPRNVARLAVIKYAVYQTP